MTEPAVVIAKGAPTGLMLAGELALAGVDAVFPHSIGREFAPFLCRESFVELDRVSSP